MNMAKYNKLWAALAGFAAQVVANGLVTGTAGAWITAVIAAVTAAGVFAVPNGVASAKRGTAGSSS